MSSQNCPCGHAQALPDCCGRFLQGEQIPNNAEALMRSRYSAYCLGDGEYILATMRGPALAASSQAIIAQTLANVHWYALHVLASRSKNTQAFVEFIAYYRENQQLGYLHERSEFEFVDGRWYYVQGQAGQMARPKLSRNNPCLCGSGKKIKNCCFAQFKY